MNFLGQSLQMLKTNPKIVILCKQIGRHKKYMDMLCQPEIDRFLAMQTDV